MRSGGGEQNLFEQNKLVTTPIGSRNYAHTEGKTSRIPQCPSRSSKGRAARAYLSALDRASIDADISAITSFVADRVKWSLKHADEGVDRQAPRR